MGTEDELAPRVQVKEVSLQRWQARSLRRWALHATLGQRLADSPL